MLSVLSLLALEARGAPDPLDVLELEEVQDAHMTWWDAVKKFGRMFAIGALLWFYNVFFDDADPVQLFWQIVLIIVAIIGVQFACAVAPAPSAVVFRPTPRPR